MFQRFFTLGIILTVCGLTQTQNLPINVTVALDGTGHFRKIQDAIDAAPKNSENRYYIRIKEGIYREYVKIGPEKTRLTLIGDGTDKTRIIGNKSVNTGFRTDDTSTVVIQGHQLVAFEISFENDAGPENSKAVALTSEVESAFYRCRFLGYQDTLYARAGRQFYRNCQIYGTVDFIWGDARLVLQFCDIYVRKPLDNQFNVITAQGRHILNGPGGTILHRCKISPAPEFLRQGLIQTYLGRPWKTYSRVIIMLSQIDGFINPKGWVMWDNSTQFDKLYYAEFKNYGLGNATKNRVNWPGFKLLNYSSQVTPYTVRNFIQGLEWIPSTRIPFLADL